MPYAGVKNAEFMVRISLKSWKGSAAVKNGFELEAIEEAEPPEEMMDIPGMKD